MRGDEFAQVFVADVCGLQAHRRAGGRAGGRTGKHANERAGRREKVLANVSGEGRREGRWG